MQLGTRTHTAGHSSGAHRQMHRHTRESPHNSSLILALRVGRLSGTVWRGWERCRHSNHPWRWVERWKWRELKNWEERSGGKKTKQKKKQPPLDHTAGTHVQTPPIPAQYSPCSCKTGTCVRGWSFFCALLWQAACRCVGKRGGGGNERVKTKTEWISMRVLTLMQKTKTTAT